MNPLGTNLQDNDVDAFRHAYVSAVLTQEYSESAAEILGRLNELLSADLYSNSKNPRALNIDLWNNGVGRKHGKEYKTREDLLKKIHRALKQGELITNLADPREYLGARARSDNAAKPVMVLKEDLTGRNELFFDLIRRVTFTRVEFIMQIQSGAYPTYSVKVIGGTATPVSDSDQRETNNLG